MASEYLKWKYKDVQPEEKIELTPQQQRKNWWHYHKWYLLLGAVGLAAAVSLLLTTLGVGRVRPDYQIAYVAAYSLPDDAVSALESALAELGEDANGDGKVSVQLNQYSGAGYSDDANPYLVMAATTKLIADFTSCDSYFFLLDNPEEFQREQHALRRLDGTLPPEGDSNWQDCCLRWTDCPALTALDLGEYDETLLDQERSGESQDLFSNLYIARRGFWSDKTCEHPEACDALWDAITEGAIS